MPRAVSRCALPPQPLSSGVDSPKILWLILWIVCSQRLPRRATALILAGLSSLPVQAQLPSGLLADFRFSGYVHNAARATVGLEAKTAQFAADRFGNPRQALLTTGSGFVGSGRVDHFKNRTSWTWAGWVRPDDLSPTAPGNFYSEGNNGLTGHVSVYQGTIMVQLWNELATPNWGSITTGPLLSLGVWSHVAVTLNTPEGSNTGTCTIYKDGIAVKTSPIPYLRVSDARAQQHQFAIGMNVGYFIGGQTWAPYAFRGSLDEVFIFDRALDAVEISQLLQVDDRLSVSPAIELHFQTDPSRKYQLQWSEDLKSWTDQGPILLGTGTEVSVPVSIRGKANRYWRIDPRE